MGSLFYINVPTRTYEVALRQKEKQIVVVQETDDIAKKNLPTNMTSGLIGARKRSSIKTSDIQQAVEGEIAGGGTMLSEAAAVASRSPSTVDVYEATAEGKRVNIVVSKDSMAIYPEEEVKDPNKPRKSVDSGQIEQKFLENVIHNTYLEKHMEDCLKKFVIYDATWAPSVDGNFAQVSFTVSANRSEAIINYMTALGIGAKYESTLSVCAAVVYYNKHQDEREKKEKEQLGEIGEEPQKRNTFTSKFIASIKSRLTVAQVVQSVSNNAVITFDYIILIHVAAIIAAVGLLENSSVNLVASMLISPLMGPIIAGCFGCVIKDKKLIKTGVISELVGIGICLFVGFVFGVSVAWQPSPGPWANIQKWPTAEMVSRSEKRGMAVGVFIAIPSGAGVALSILAGNAGSLVGVAISASLLPPAVNAGMEWGVALVHAIHSSKDAFASCNGNDSLVHAAHAAEHFRNHTFIYCRNNMAMEFALMGICSFGLTVVNIALILLVGAVVLKIKEVAPHTTRKTMNRFWKEDLKAMRDYNKVHGTFNKQEIFNELNESSEVRDELQKDATFKSITARSAINGSGNILDTQAPDAESVQENEGGEGSGNFLTKWFSKSKPTEPEAEEVLSEANSQHRTKRPHLAKSMGLKPSPTKKTVKK